MKVHSNIFIPCLLVGKIPNIMMNKLLPVYSFMTVTVDRTDIR